MKKQKIKVKKGQHKGKQFECVKTNDKFVVRDPNFPVGQEQEIF